LSPDAAPLRLLALPVVLPFLLLLGAPARAAEGLQPEVRGGLGAGSMVSSAQRDLGFKLTLLGEVRPALRLDRMFALELALANWAFPSDRTGGHATLVGAGGRLDPALGSRLRWFGDWHGGLGLTGGTSRFMFDVGTGLECALTRQVAMGPFLRYGQMVDGRADPRFLAGGLLVALSFPPAPRPPPAPVAPVRLDVDHDGVMDDEDQCPTEPQGAKPDPARKGCPLRDRDNDGVFDEQDKCPDQPAGPTPDPERAGCPDGDDDKDGVPNSQDKCRDQAPGMFPDPTTPGCPLPDRDKDSVPDLYDSCPDKPGAPDPDPKKNGCPGLVSIEANQIKILKPVFFATGKDVILQRSFPVLRAVAGALTATAAIKKVSIEGHTDGQGTPEGNQELSQRRAESVRSWLLQHGVAAERLEARGFGDTRPLATNKTARGRAENRRVEFIILDPAPEPPRAPVDPAPVTPEKTP
jgi:outer membrane protein OmpA-like peptidoglycan-associated protein